jgi:hypothetical protein
MGNSYNKVTDYFTFTLHFHHLNTPCMFGVLCPPSTLVGGTGVGCHFLLWCVFLITSISVTDPSGTVITHTWFLFPVNCNSISVPFVHHCLVDYCHNVRWCV